MKFVGNIASDSEVVATADGAITAGKPVVVNADGTVKFAGPTSTTISAGIGSEVTFESAAARKLFKFDEVIFPLKVLPSLPNKYPRVRRGTSTEKRKANCRANDADFPIGNSDSKSTLLAP